MKVKESGSMSGTWNVFDRTSYYYRMVLFVLIYITGGDDDGADVGDNGHDGKDDGDD